MSTILLSFAGATALINSSQVAGSISNQLTSSGALVVHTFCQCDRGSSMDWSCPSVSSSPLRQKVTLRGRKGYLTFRTGFTGFER